MQHFVYQTTNTANGMIYIGVRSGSTNDDYLGSGKHLKAAIKKYGRTFFTRRVLAIFDTVEAAYLHEQLIVDAVFVGRTDTYNLKLGGIGGWGSLAGTTRLVDKNSGRSIRVPTGEIHSGFSGNTKGLKYFNDGLRSYRLNPTVDDTNNLKPGRLWTASGRKWFNDGQQSFFITPSSADGLTEGRLGIVNEHRQGAKDTPETRRRKSEGLLRYHATSKVEMSIKTGTATAR